MTYLRIAPIILLTGMLAYAISFIVALEPHGYRSGSPYPSNGRERLPEVNQSCVRGQSQRQYTSLKAAMDAHLSVCSLDLSHNNLDRFPQEIIQLENLESLSITHNNLRSVPEDIRELKRLRVIDLTGNPMTRDYIDRLRTMLPNTVVLFLRPMYVP